MSNHPMTGLVLHPRPSGGEARTYDFIRVEIRWEDGIGRAFYTKHRDKDPKAVLSSDHKAVSCDLELYGIRTRGDTPEQRAKLIFQALLCMKDLTEAVVYASEVNGWLIAAAMITDAEGDAPDELNSLMRGALEQTITNTAYVFEPDIDGETIHWQVMSATYILFEVISAP